ncbi:DUF732 domain-containing protein [Nocardia sp. NBC_01388]
MVAVAIIALIRGHIDWLRLRNRKSAGALLAASFVVVIAGGLIAPKKAGTKPAAAVSQSAPATVAATTAAQVTTTVPPTTTTPSPTTTTGATTTTVAPTTTDAATTTAGLSDQQIDDLAFIGVLDMNHVHYTDKNAAIDVAHKICNARADGNSETEVGLAILKTGAYSAADSGTIVGAAEASYCPQYK